MNSKKIAVILEGRVQYEREVLRGIREFASGRDNWLIRLVLPGNRTGRSIDEWQPDGILFQSASLSRSMIKNLSTQRHAIHLSESNHLRCVGLDNLEIGRQAAEYLIRRRFKSYGYIGYQQIGFSAKRELSFRNHINLSQYPCQSLDLSSSPSEREIASWLKSLPRPCGLFVTHDECALFISTICHSNGLRIPEDIAILGVDNDTLICEIAWPQLSSVTVPSRQVGRAAAERLHRLFNSRHKAVNESLLLPPTGIVTRQSTDTQQTENEQVNRALRYMEAHYRNRINVDDILRETGVSRRLLERSFSEHVGATPLQELQRLRIEAAERLLAETNLPLQQIAPQCGCRDATQLGILFKKLRKITPGEYRKQLTTHR